MKAFFAGSFHPFTIGHANLVERALALFSDGIVIGIGCNADKPDAALDAETRAEDIRAIYAGNPRVKVTVYRGLTAEAARDCEAGVLLRGIRSGADLDYERQLADANMRLFGLDTVMLVTAPDLGWVSSSLVRDLQRHGRDTSSLLPRPAEN